MLTDSLRRGDLNRQSTDCGVTEAQHVILKASRQLGAARLSSLAKRQLLTCA
jgi:hypothetical protein